MNKRINLNNPTAWSEFDWIDPVVPEALKRTDGAVNVARANRLKAQSPVWKENLKKSTSTEEYKANLKAGKEKFWENAPDSHRDHIAKKSQEASLTFESVEQAKEIFNKCWGEDRGEKLYKKLAKEYNVSFHGIITLVRGNFDQTVHAYCPVSAEQLTVMKEDWEKKYQSIKIVAVRPGFDQLNNYDRLFFESKQYQKVHLAWKLSTPSVVFHCRYLLENPTPYTVRDYCNSIGIPQLKNDLGQYKKILNDQYTWLKNSPSEKFEFDSYEKLGEFLTNHSDNKDKLVVNRASAWDYVKNRFQWRGNNFLGWMFYVEEN